MKPEKIPNFLKIYIFPADTCKELSKKKKEKSQVILKTFILSLILNMGLPIASLPLINYQLRYEPFLISIMLSIFTFIAILGIEYLTYLVSRWRNGKGNFISQLNITNTYLILVFFAVLLCELLFAFLLVGPEFVFGIYILCYILIIYLNYEKIEAVHTIRATTYPSIAYGLLILISFVIWFFIGLSLGAGDIFA